MKVRSFLASAVATAALVPAGTAAAEGLDYTYLDFGYLNSTLDVGGIDVDGDGFGVRGSYDIAGGFALVGGYSTQEFDGGVDLSAIEAGVGWHMPMTESMDFVSHLTFISAEADSGVASVEEDGYGLGVGLRGMFNPQFEWEGGVDFSDVGDTNTAFRADGRYHFTPAFSAGAGVTVDDDTTMWRVGLRAVLGAK